MSDNEKLRALLAEARETLSLHDGVVECDHPECRLYRFFSKGIDAALAEPVEGPLNAISRLQQQLHEAKSNADWLVQRAQRERDEARAEVRRTYKELSESIAREAAAYERGAEAMREAAAQYVEDADDGVPLKMLADDGIRALPVPEDKP